MNTVEEIWKDIPEYEGFYQVSNIGRVKSLDRVILRKSNSLLTLKGCLIKQHKDNEGYYCSLLSKVGRTKTFKTHQLVAMAFLDHKPNGFKIVVDHINNIKSDNRLENLQLISARENTSKDRLFGTSRYTGVYWHKKHNKWSAMIQISGKRKYLGSYVNEHDAHLAYQKALQEIINQNNKTNEY